jgi:hypothetical protein
MVLLFLFLLVSFVQDCNSLTWIKHTIPLTGELVLTDVHAIIEDSRIIALASGEGGVLLKLDIPISESPPFSWTTLLDTSFPTYWYGVYAFNATSYLISGFLDGNGEAFGVVAFSDDGGKSWGNDTKIDPCGKADCAWGGGPIEFANLTEGYMPSTSGESSWRTQAGGRNASEWTEITPSEGQWFAGNFIYDKSGLIRIAGSNDCTSTDFAMTWNCRNAWDSTGIDSAINCAGSTCIVGGGEISPSVAGWVHLSTDHGSTFSPDRILNSDFPIRSVQVIQKSITPPVLIAAGGNFFSGQGGVYSSENGGKSWNLDINLGEEIKACRTLALSNSTNRVFCVSAGSKGGSIISTDISM